MTALHDARERLLRDVELAPGFMRPDMRASAEVVIAALHAATAEVERLRAIEALWERVADLADEEATT